MSDQGNNEVLNSSAKKPVVLVVDDVDDVRIYIKKILEEISVDVILCKNGHELLNIIEKQEINFNLILLDLSMPELSGIDVLKKILELKLTLNYKICVLSGMNDSSIINKAIELKADEFLIKPIEKLTFLNRIRHLLNIEQDLVSEFAYVKVNFYGEILKYPLMAHFKIVGITEEGLIIESAINYVLESIVQFESQELCEAIQLNQPFFFRVVKSKHLESGKYLLTCVFFSSSEFVASKIRAFTVRRAESSTSVLI